MQLHGRDGGVAGWFNQPKPAPHVGGFVGIKFERRSGDVRIFSRHELNRDSRPGYTGYMLF